MAPPHQLKGFFYGLQDQDVYSEMKIMKRVSAGRKVINMLNGILWKTKRITHSKFENMLAVWNRDMDGPYR